VGHRVGQMVKNLNDREVKALKKKGHGSYRVSAGLYLRIEPSGSQRWIARLQSNGKRHDFGLGSFSDVSLHNARVEIEHYRRELKAGRDPRIKSGEINRIWTFKEAAYAVWEERKPSWKNVKHGQEWMKTLERYVFPTLGAFRVDQVTHALVRDVLAKIWLKIPETASRVAQRIKVVMDWCAAREYCPPISMDVVRAGLPKAKRKINHFRSMPWAEIPSFLTSMSRAGEKTRLALELTILTAARSGEIRGMRWSEVSLERQEWAIAGDRMKMGEDHVVPLSTRAMGVLGTATKWRDQTQNDPLVFPNSKGNPLSDMTLTMPLRRMFGEGAPTVHGFRSSFTDWAAESTDFPREVVDAALSHRTGNKVDVAYRRTDFKQKRRELMERWAKFLNAEPSF